MDTYYIEVKPHSTLSDGTIEVEMMGNIECDRIYCINSDYLLNKEEILKEYQHCLNYVLDELPVEEQVRVFGKNVAIRNLPPSVIITAVNDILATPCKNEIWRNDRRTVLITDVVDEPKPKGTVFFIEFYNDHFESHHLFMKDFKKGNYIRIKEHSIGASELISELNSF